jgi:eukaryotic-like serine/threonine-protein kinase
MSRKDLIKFLVSKHFFNNLAIAIGIALGIFVLLFISLRIYTHHGEALAVPDLFGYTLEEADSVINDRMMTYKVIDSVYIQELEKGTVVEQHPKPNFKVKENRTIFITMNAQSPEKIVMPKVTEVSLRQAEALLTSHGLRLGELIYKPDVAKNYVLDQQHDGQQIEPGDTIVKGSIINLVLGTGLGGQATGVPDLLGLTWREADDVTKDAFLNLGFPIYDNSILTEEDSLNAKIYRQKPMAGRQIQIPMGSYIDVWLTADTVKLQETIEITETENEEFLY